ncbi:MAG TPA: caspase family protein [Burkholderiaceae bacterium]|jgi:hypothetical protein
MSLSRRACLLAPIALTGCAHAVMGYQPVFQAHEVPDSLIDTVRQRLHAEGLREADAGRDMVGRVSLTGRFRDEDEADKGLLIVRSIVGLNSSSPFYPENIAERRWEKAAQAALSQHAKAQAVQVPPSRKRALVIGINRFMDEAHLRPLQGEDDARLVATRLRAAGYAVTALFGPQASRAAIEAAIAQMRKDLGADDVLFIYISSHGALPLPLPEGGESRRMSIVAYDSGDVLGEHSPDATAYLLKLERSSVRDSLVQDLANAPTRQTRVLIDTCYSGDMLDPLPSANLEFTRNANGGRVERESISMSTWAAIAERTRSRYTLLTATSPGELALGPPSDRGVFASPLNPARQLRGSFFTQTLFEYLDRHQGLLHPAFAEAKAYTANLAQIVTRGQQTQTPRMLSTMEDAQDRL